MVVSRQELNTLISKHGLEPSRDAILASARTGLRIRKGAHEWRLLLQVDSDDDLGAMWGDLGMVYFWIRGADLLSGSFGSTWTILQCG